MTDVPSSDRYALARAREGTRINDKYTIQELLGVGGMAAVYSAQHRNKKRCAIKILHAELSAVRHVRERFLREGYVANTVDHPGAVLVDDDDMTPDGCVYLVMELLQGETVESMAQRAGGTLDPQTVILLMDQLLDVLAAAHAKGIVHRDIKPENMFVQRSGQLKVLDFGIAHLQEAGGYAEIRRTVDGSVMGTPAFMAPEQARGRWEEVDAQSDLWSVGATMFALLTGDIVHRGATVNEALAAAITESARPIRHLLPALHPGLAEVVDTALKREKAARFADAVAMRAALRALHVESYCHARPACPSTIHAGSSGAVQGLAGPWSTASPSGPGSVGALPGAQTTIDYADLLETISTSPPVTAPQLAPRHPGRTPALLALVSLVAVLLVIALSSDWFSRPEGPHTGAQSLPAGEELSPAASAQPQSSAALESRDGLTRGPDPQGLAAISKVATPSERSEPANGARAESGARAETQPFSVERERGTPGVTSTAATRSITPTPRASLQAAPPRSRPPKPRASKPVKDFDPFAKRD